MITELLVGYSFDQQTMVEHVFLGGENYFVTGNNCPNDYEFDSESVEKLINDLPPVIVDKKKYKLFFREIDYEGTRSGEYEYIIGIKLNELGVNYSTSMPVTKEDINKFPLYEKAIKQVLDLSEHYKLYPKKWWNGSKYYFEDVGFYVVTDRERYSEK